MKKGLGFTGKADIKLTLKQKDLLKVYKSGYKRHRETIEAITRFKLVKHQLERPFMKISDIAGKIIKAKATTLLNWDADITERSTEAKIKQKPWNRFCILDIVILDVARELRQRGLSHKQMVALCKWLKMKFVDRQVIINFSMGRSLLIIYDFASVRLVTKQKGTNVVRIGTIKTSLLIVPLHLAIRKILKNRILRKLYDSDFRVKFSISNKAIYIIEGKKITLTDIPPEPDEDTAEALLSKIHDRL